MKIKLVSSLSHSLTAIHIYSDSVCVCVCVCVCVSADINLGHEPELQSGWTRLQEKVSSTRLCLLLPLGNIEWTVVYILRACM